MKTRLFTVSFCFLGCLLQAAAPDVASVKSYLVSTAERMQSASEKFVSDSDAYLVLWKQHADDAKAVAADPRTEALILAMREDYKAMDSFGYETIEGIVAGVPSLGAFDVYLDAGVAQGDGEPDEIAMVVLKLDNGKTVDKEGSLFTLLIEPALWQSRDNRTIAVPGSETRLPDPWLLSAAAKDVSAKITELVGAAKAWEPSPADLFGALIEMTPTLSDYFEEWKESRYAGDESTGLFAAVSRVSDMKGIMGSCQVMYVAAHPALLAKDPALANSIHAGFEEILAFIGKLEDREKSRALTVVEVEELTAQAKSKTDRLVPQIQQAVAVLEIQL